MGRHSMIKKVEAGNGLELQHYCNCKKGTVTEDDQPGGFEPVDVVEDGICVYCGYYAVTEMPQFYDLADGEVEMDEECPVHLDYFRFLK